MIDLSRCNIKPYAHQVIGIEKLLENPYFFITDEMGAGKTLQVIVAAQLLFERGDITRVLVITPASVRSVWYDETFGELKKHLFVPSVITEYHSKLRGWYSHGKQDNMLNWFITNYEFVRSKNRLTQLLPYATQKTLLILDESSSVKSWRAAQTKACLSLRKDCGRVVLLNGTPIANNPGDLYSQGEILSKSILGLKNWFHFRARYGILGGWQQKQIISWRDIDDIQRRFAPYILRRLKKDCLDLPDKLPPVVLSVPMQEPEWKIYKAMRDEMVSWLSDSTVASASQAIVKVMRLAQITSGFLGGVQELELDDVDLENPQEAKSEPIPVQEIGRTKLDFFLMWLEERLEEDPNFKVIVWSRFVPEIARCIRETKLKYPDIPVGVVAGGYKKADREFALRLLDPRTAPTGPAFVFGNPQSGGLGLNMTAAKNMYRISNDYSHFKRAQSEDRIHRPGQTEATSYYDSIATGPNGQKTIDHIVLSALLKKDDLATLTTSAWVSKLKEE